MLRDKPIIATTSGIRRKRRGRSGVFSLTVRLLKWAEKCLQFTTTYQSILLSISLGESAGNKKGPALLQALDFIGSPRRTRTADPVINSHLLYRLSYRGIEKVLVSRLFSVTARAPSRALSQDFGVAGHVLVHRIAGQMAAAPLAIATLTGMQRRSPFTRPGHRIPVSQIPLKARAATPNPATGRAISGLRVWSWARRGGRRPS